MGFKFVEREVVFSFEEVLAIHTSNFVEVKITGYDCEHVVNGMTIRKVLRVLALQYVRALAGLNLPDDNEKIDSIVTWNDNEYVVKLAWIEEEENDLDES